MVGCDSTCSTILFSFIPKSSEKIPRFLGEVALETMVILENEAIFSMRQVSETRTCLSSNNLNWIRMRRFDSLMTKFFFRDSIWCSVDFL